jgi:hypothetical protein
MVAQRSFGMFTSAFPTLPAKTTGEIQKRRNLEPAKLQRIMSCAVFCLFTTRFRPVNRIDHRPEAADKSTLHTTFGGMNSGVEKARK